MDSAIGPVVSVAPIGAKRPDRVGEDQDIRPNSAMLGGKHPAGAAEAGRNLVEDKQRPVAAAKLPGAAQEGRLGH